MSFKFNFPSPDVPVTKKRKKSDADGPFSQNSEEQRSSECKSIIAEEIKLPDDCQIVYENARVGGSLEPEESMFLHLVDSKQAEKHIQETGSPLASAFNKDSDLVPNVYEGGLKTWECSHDLVSYLSSSDIKWKGMKVLELGCGSALPGLYSLLKGAKVHFQDYNKEVINFITIPNVLLNLDEEEAHSRARFFCGDWASLATVLLQADANIKYDMILTSETIYSIESQEKLLKLMKLVLKDDGVIYLAAKAHYFGVGGGTKQFEERIRQDGILQAESVKIIEEGLKREIMKITFHNRKKKKKL